jgi:hypothetical protein
MTEIKPIETRYAGCRFRSRLEARWAVFFDALGIQWEYEPQGYEGVAGRYLPDFRLPDQDLWVEVKGDLGHHDFLRTMLAVPNLRDSYSGFITPQLLLLGPIPRPGLAWTHVRIDIFQGTLMWQQTFFAGPPWYPQEIGRAVPLPTEALERLNNEASREHEGLTELVRDSTIKPAHDQRLTVDPAVDQAYRVARSARFEFGEHG